MISMLAIEGAVDAADPSASPLDVLAGEGFRVYGSARGGAKTPLMIE